MLLETNVAALLADNLEAGHLQGADQILARDDRKFTH
jgi:hypothetical protein